MAAPSLRTSVQGPAIIEIAVLKEEDTYHAWYCQYTADTIRYATSANGIDWTIQRTVLKGPQFRDGGLETWSKSVTPTI